MVLINSLDNINFHKEKNNNINEICNKIKTEGYFVYKNFNTNIQDIDKEFENIINDKKNNFDKNTGKNRCLRTNLNNNYINENIFPNICRLFNNKFIIKICNEFNITFSNDKKDLFIHKDYECLNTNNTYPHFDIDRKLKFYFCLNDMNSNNGCFKVFSNSIKMVENIRNKIGKNKNVFNKNHSNYNGIHIDINELTFLEAEKGDLIIFDTNCIHAGGDKFNDGKFRKVIRLHLIL